MRWIAEHRNEFRVSRMAEVFEVSSSGVYSYSKRGPSPRSQENQALGKTNSRGALKKS